MTREATVADFERLDAQEYEKVAVYFPSMDYVDYIRNDGVAICERIDRFLTVMRNEDGEMIGFKLKGIKNFFLKRLKPALSLEDEDFVYVKDMFVALATAMGDEMFPDDDKQRKRTQAYRNASRIAREDQVRFVMPAAIAA
ncbi:MAG: hypothetical protein AAGC79_16830 [Pseudomonadota bacterium]